MAQEETGRLDRFFAERILKEEYSEERGHFLRTLMRYSRQGDLCWENPSAPSLPNFVLSEGKELFPTTPVVKQANRYYLQRNWVYETAILEQLKRLLAQSPPSFYETALFQRALQEETQLSREQKRAIEGAFERSFSLISGGPGTGKTYTATVFLRALVACSSKKLKIALTAPTGKAASHLEAALLAKGSLSAQVEVRTLHRLLQLKPGENRLFSQRKVDADVVIVDESSMIDVPLLAHLLEAIGPATRLVMMGDPDQLPPVEESSLFGEIAALLAIPLQGSMRTDKAHLHNLAYQINQGQFPFALALPWPFDSTLPPKLYQAMSPFLSWQEPDPQQIFSDLDRFRILSALRQGPFGTEQLNRYILNEMGKQLKPGQWWAVPLMITVNAPRLELYNGTCGLLIGQSRGGLHLREGTAYFPERLSYKELPPFELAFCLSIHKSQGSEFDRVLALFPPGSENFGREALYTAVTRAKTAVDVVGEEKTLQLMLAQRAKRASGLAQRLSEVSPLEKRGLGIT